MADKKSPMLARSFISLRCGGGYAVHSGGVRGVGGDQSEEEAEEEIYYVGEMRLGLIPTILVIKV
jgi:hypothetical protein